jgi:hypothetical protein
VSNEFSSLFGATWADEAPVQALADYIREKLEEYPHHILVATHDLRKAEVTLAVVRYYGQENVVLASLTVDKHYYKHERDFRLEQLTTPEFTEWLAEWMNAISVYALKSW